MNEKSRMHPFWLILAISIPQFILGGILVSSFQTIKSILNQTSTSSWYLLITFTVLSIVGSSIYAAHLIRFKRGISPRAGLLSIGFHLPVLLGFTYHTWHFTENVPNWMVNRGELEMFMMTFHMAPILLGLVVVVKGFISDGFAVFKQIGPAFIVPVVWYFATFLLMELVGGSARFDNIIFSGGAVLVALTFSFLLLRGFYYLSNRHAQRLDDSRHIILAILAGVFSLIGLILNSGLPFEAKEGMHIFGNFGHPLFYIIALANAIFVCLPNSQKTNNRLVIFILRSFTYSYIVYFFLVFLPFLPFSLFAILAAGTGFLMMTPLILTIMQGKILREDFNFLSNRMPKGRLVAFALAAFLILPASLVIHFYKDKYYFKTAINYLYHPNLQKPAPKVNTASIERVLSLVKNHRSGRNSGIGFGLDGHRTPYISNIYEKIVLEGLTLNNDKIREMERIFSGKAKTYSWNRQRRPSNPEQISIDTVQAISSFDDGGGFWRSTVQIDIQNHTERNFTEYASNFELPEGAYISDYYLWIEGRKEKGILAEKKAALWIYNQITRRNRDPGLLFYQDNQQVGFHVFPFSARQKRQTGFEIIHKEPFTFQLDDKTVNLGKPNEQPLLHDLGHLSYLNAPYKQQLPKVERKPYFHFILDYSATTKGQFENYQKAMTELQNKHPELMPNSQISITNYRSEHFKLADWSLDKTTIERSGGFYPERVIQEILVNNYDSPSDQYPLFVLLSERKGIDFEKIEGLEFTMPEQNIFFRYSEGSLQNLRTKASNTSIQAETSYAYPSLAKATAYLPIDDAPALIVNDADYDFATAPVKNQWEKGLNLQAFWYASQLRPHLDGRNWRKMVQGSFDAQVLTPVTSFIALENEAQKNVLQQKQEQALKGDSALDLSDEVTNMPEPSLWWILLILFAVVGIRFIMEEMVDKD